jgi:CRP-like cAMP-binding protein
MVRHHHHTPYPHAYARPAPQFSEKHATINVRALTHCDVYKLRRNDFEEVVRDNPSQALHIVTTARAILDEDSAKGERSTRDAGT